MEMISYAHKNLLINAKKKETQKIRTLKTL